MHDPAYPEACPVRHGAVHVYGELGVYDRSNTQVRAFTYDAQHPGRMVAHRYAEGRRCATLRRYRAGGGAAEGPELPLPV
nr:hypothetical protein [Escherichia coli]